MYKYTVQSQSYCIPVFTIVNFVINTMWSLKKYLQCLDDTIFPRFTDH